MNLIGSGTLSCIKKQVRYVDNDGDSATGNTVLMEMMAHHDWDDAANDLIVKECDVNSAKQGAENGAAPRIHLRAPQYRARPGRENVGTNDALFEAAAQENWYYQKDRSHIESMTESEAEQEFIKLLGKFQPSSTQVDVHERERKHGTGEDDDPPRLARRDQGPYRKEIRHEPAGQGLCAAHRE